MAATQDMDPEVERGQEQGQGPGPAQPGSAAFANYFAREGDKDDDDRDDQADSGGDESALHTLPYLQLGGNGQRASGQVQWSAWTVCARASTRVHT